MAEVVVIALINYDPGRLDKRTVLHDEFDINSVEFKHCRHQWCNLCGVWDVRAVSTPIACVFAAAV